MSLFLLGLQIQLYKKRGFMKTKNIVLGTVALGLGLTIISCDTYKYDKYSLQITTTSVTSGSGTSLSTSTLSETGVNSGENCDLNITPQFASGSTWEDCSVIATMGTPFGAGTSSVATAAITCTGLTGGNAGRFAVAYSGCDAGTSDFTKNTSNFTFS